MNQVLYTSLIIVCEMVCCLHFTDEGVDSFPFALFSESAPPCFLFVYECGLYQLVSVPRLTALLKIILSSVLVLKFHLFFSLSQAICIMQCPLILPTDSQKKFSLLPLNFITPHSPSRMRTPSYLVTPETPRTINSTTH